MTATSPAHARAEIATAHASRYLQQLCKHFAHKLPVEFDPQTGKIAFPIGEVALKADDARLALDLTAPTALDLPQLKDVVIRHLARFAFREELAVAWAE